MAERTHSRESGIDATKASARLAGLDIDIIHRQSPSGGWEQVSINVTCNALLRSARALVRGSRSFHALGSRRAIDVDAVAASGADDDVAGRQAANAPERRPPSARGADA
jgi:hypothetical protein